MTILENIVSLKVEGISSSGEGYAIYNGKKLYFPYTALGDEVLANIITNDKGAVKAEIIEVNTLSPHRGKAACKHFPACGGCLLQHLSEEEYKNYKRNKAITSIANAGFTTIPEIVFAPHFSRRRATIKLSGGKVGFFKRETNEVVDISECFVLEKELFEIAKALKTFASENFSEVTLTKADSGIDALFEVKRELTVSDINSLNIFAKENNLARLSIRYEGKTRVVYEAEKITMNYGDAKIAMPLEYFLQPTLFGQQEITKFILNNLKGARRIVDLFAGAGTYSFPASLITKVHAVEESAEMVAAIKAKGGNVTAERRNLDKLSLTVRELSDYDVAVINPPRTGALNQSKNLSKSMIRKIIMVSCNPETFARDAKLFKEAGFSIINAKAIDQFLWTEHLEIVATFLRR